MAPQSWAVREFCPGHVSQISGLKIGFVSPSPHPKGGHGVASGGGGGSKHANCWNLRCDMCNWHFCLFAYIYVYVYIC